MSAWNALFAPKGTPKEIVAKLNETLVQGARRSGDHASVCSISAACSPKARAARREALAELVKSEVARWNPILKGAAAPAQ